MGSGWSSYFTFNESHWCQTPGSVKSALGFSHVLLCPAILPYRQLTLVIQLFTVSLLKILLTLQTEPSSDIASNLLILLLSVLPDGLILCWILPVLHYIIAQSISIMQSWFTNYDKKHSMQNLTILLDRLYLWKCAVKIVTIFKACFWMLPVFTPSKYCSIPIP